MPGRLHEEVTPDPHDSKGCAKPREDVVVLSCMRHPFVMHVGVPEHPAPLNLCMWGQRAPQRDRNPTPNFPKAETISVGHTHSPGQNLWREQENM